MTGQGTPPPEERYLGVDLGGTKTYAVVTDVEGRVLGESTVSTPRRASDAALLEAIVGVSEKARQAAGITWNAIASLGVGAPGTVDVMPGLWSGSTNVVLDHPPMELAKALRERIGRPVFVDNDVRAATYGEFRCGGWPRHEMQDLQDSFVFISVGTGLAAGVILGGALYRGRGEAAELGHVIVEPDGFPCACGQRGCLETVASGRALERWGRDAVDASWTSRLLVATNGDPDLVTGQLIYDCAKAGDAVAQDLLDRLAHGIAQAVLMAMRVYDPDVIVLGGGVLARAGERLFDATLTALTRIRGIGLDRRELGRKTDAERIIMSKIGWRAGGIGAALLAAARHADHASNLRP